MAPFRDLAPSEVDSARPRPEAVAAIVNALLVLLVPVGWSVATWLTVDSTGRARARASSDLEQTVATLGLMALVMAPFVPLAMISGWRTWVHARRYCAQQGRGWQGVAEAGALGFVVAVVVLARGILTRPAEALAYVVAYGGVAAIVGLAVGFILRLSALLALHVTARRPTWPD